MAICFMTNYMQNQKNMKLLLRPFIWSRFIIRLQPWHARTPLSACPSLHTNSPGGSPYSVHLHLYSDVKVYSHQCFNFSKTFPRIWKILEDFRTFWVIFRTWNSNSLTNQVIYRNNRHFEFYFRKLYFKIWMSWFNKYLLINERKYKPHW